MRKKAIIITCLILISVLLCSCSRGCACSCKKDKTNPFDEFVNIIYSSEESLKGFNEETTIKDGEMVIYSKSNNMKLDRGDNVKTEVNIIEKKLSTKGDVVYDETITSYTTVDNVKYTVLDGVTYENEYVIPTYYLTFVLSSEFLQEGYTFENNENNYKLVAKVIDNKIGSLFLNKSLGNLTNMTIEIVVENSKLVSFNASYTTTNGFDAQIQTTYSY